MNLAARLARLEGTASPATCHVVEIDGWLGMSERSAAIASALAARCVNAKPRDLVIGLRRFGGVR